MPPLFVVVACTPRAEFEISPEELSFGEVDVDGDMPEDGYAVERVTLTNVGSATITLWLPEYDFDRLCLAGYADDLDYPVEVGPAATDQAYVLDVGICGYLDGEEDQYVDTVVEVLTDGVPEVLSVPVRFKPDQFDDT